MNQAIGFDELNTGDRLIIETTRGTELQLEVRKAVTKAGSTYLLVTIVGISEDDHNLASGKEAELRTNDLGNQSPADIVADISVHGGVPTIQPGYSATLVQRGAGIAAFQVATVTHEKQ